MSEFKVIDAEKNAWNLQLIRALFDRELGQIEEFKGKTGKINSIIYTTCSFYGNVSKNVSFFLHCDSSRKIWEKLISGYAVQVQVLRVKLIKEWVPTWRRKKWPN